ncbi:MAG: hypothetical protein ACI4BC_07540 [Muribaculaceae bacterium]
MTPLFALSAVAFRHDPSCPDISAISSDRLVCFCNGSTRASLHSRTYVFSTVNFVIALSMYTTLCRTSCSSHAYTISAIKSVAASKVFSHSHRRYFTGTFSLNPTICWMSL